MFLASKRVHKSETVGPSGFFIYILRGPEEIRFFVNIWMVRDRPFFISLVVSLLIFVHVTFGAHGDASQPEKRALYLQSRKEENLQRKKG